MAAIKYHSYELPVAFSMIELAALSSQEDNLPFAEYTCYWTAFNNIYRTYADQKGLRPTIKKKGGSIKFNIRGGVQIAQVESVPEWKQIANIFKSFSHELKHNLIIHESSRFFANRTPRINGTPLEFDGLGQRINGVLNVGQTIDRDHPVWSPIDVLKYNNYLMSPASDSDRNDLAEQILNILYTIRNNIVHGGKRADDANDYEVIGYAIPLLQMIVFDFLHLR